MLEGSSLTVIELRRKLQNRLIQFQGRPELTPTGYVIHQRIDELLCCDFLCLEIMSALEVDSNNGRTPTAVPFHRTLWFFDERSASP